jgi:hypothetical protein
MPLEAPRASTKYAATKPHPLSIFVVSKFANWALSAKFAKYMPLENTHLSPSTNQQTSVSRQQKVLLWSSVLCMAF